VRLRLALIVAAGLVNAACSSDAWFGGSDDPPLPGERVPVMLLERQLEADPSLANLPIHLPPPQTNPAWPQAGGYPGHAMHHLAASDELQLTWRSSIGEAPEDGQLLARPVVAEGRVYVMDAAAKISAIDASTGAVVWEHQPEGLDADDALLGGGLAYGGGWLFATTSSGIVLGLNAESGTEVWRQDLSLPLRAAPTVAGDRVLVLSADNQLYALEGTSGVPIWRHAGFFESAGLLGGPSPAADRGVVVVPYSSAEVFALRLDTGAPLWSDTVERPRQTLALAEINDIDGLPVIDGDLVYVVSHGGQMAALDLRRGVRAWDLDIASTETPWLAGDFIYLLTTRGEVVCLLRDNGRIRWVSPLPHLSEPDDPESAPITWSGPLLVGDRLLLAGSDGELLAMSPYNGEILGRLPLDAPVLTPPVVAERTVYVLTESAELLAYS
jgi:outer membrane protein assembly factor BamB